MKTAPTTRQAKIIVTRSQQVIEFAISLQNTIGTFNGEKVCLW
jgi:hypothetical protein